jgi:hypothetical protein
MYFDKIMHGSIILVRIIFFQATRPQHSVQQQALVSNYNVFWAMSHWYVVIDFFTLDKAI